MIKKKKNGFTLIELLVVIAIIALLLSILLPSLKKAKQIAQAVICTSNTKQLTLAWQLYADDNHGKLCDGENSPNGYGPDLWVQRMAQSGDPGYSSGMTAVEREIVGIQNGALYPYSKNEKIYHCPADPIFKKYRTMMTLPNSNMSPYRTFAIIGSMNGGDGFEITKITQMRSTSDKYVFVEEADEGKGGHNWGSWRLNPDPSSNTWWDPISVWHNKASVFGFADGHAGIRKWRNKSTEDLANKLLGPGESFTGGYEDLRWAQRGYLYNN